VICLQFIGVVLHHSACPSINGKGFDFYITKDAAILPGTEPTAPDRLHVCVEGDFNAVGTYLTGERREQLFVLQKLLLRLAELYGFDPTELVPHDPDCPGKRFPWEELVISLRDGYH
jgi:hypothetical protein